VLAVLLFATALDIVNAAVDQSIKSDHLRQNYAMTQETVSRSAGKQTVKVYEMSYRNGKPVRKLIRENGRPITNSQFESYKSNEPRRVEMLRELPKALDFKMVGEERIEGNDCWVLYATPKPGYKPPAMRMAFLTQMEAKVWISKEHSRMLRMDARTVGPVSFGGFLARLEPGTRIYLEQSRVDDGLWLPTRFKMAYDGRFLFKTFKGEVEQISSNFRKISPAT
jgi:hypothetical protein